MSVGLGLLNRVVRDGASPTALSEAGVTRDSFIGDERKVYDLVVSHFASYRVLPTLETITAETGVSFPRFPAEPLGYWIDRVEQRLRVGMLAKASKVIQEAAAEGKLSEAIDEVRTLYLGLQKRGAIDQIVTLANVASEVMTLHDNLQRSGRRSGVPFGFPYLDEVSSGAQPADTVALVGRPSQGKSQPLDAVIVTVDDVKRMKELKIGDSLASIDGEESKVLDIYPQGKRQVYRVSFSDGRSAECDGSHLWEVSFRQWKEPRVVTTEKLKEMLKRKRFCKRLHVPLCSGDFGNNEKLPLDPWLVGFLLGDGSLTQCVGFSTGDYELVEKVQATVLPMGYTAVSRGNRSYSIVSVGSGSPINKIGKILEELSMLGKKSPQKTIPDCYMRASKSARFDLLRGLMDTDGTVGEDHAVTFSSSSKEMAVQVVSLVRSLGGTASVTPKKTNRLLSYRVGIKFEHPKQLFSLKRKRERCLEKRQRLGVPRPVRLTVSKVEFVGTKECQCIRVSHPSGLYLTEDYVVTHNSYILMNMANYAYDHGETPLVATYEMAPVQCARRILALRTHVSATTIRLGRLSYWGREKVLTDIGRLGDMSGRPFHLMQGTLKSTVEDLVLRVQELRPTVVYVDGAYLLRTASKNASRWERVSETAEYLKMIASEFAIPVIATYQFNRKGAGTLGNIAYSDAIGQLASIVLGIDDEDVDGDKGKTTFAARVYKQLELLKGREGERGTLRLLYDMERMFITQDAVLSGFKIMGQEE